jgi:tetratricopeptide (TPR) repeat protein
MNYDDEENDNDYYDGNLNEELDRFEKSLTGEPLGFMDSDTLEAIIDHYLIQGNYTKANLCAEIGIQQFPFIPLFTLRKAQAISANGQLKEALNLLSQLEKSGITSCEHFLTKASIFSQLRDSKTAIKYFTEALNVAEPEDRDEIFVDLAMEYETARDFKNAVRILKKALETNPNNEVAIYELAFCYDQMEDFDSAIKCYSDFINENPYSFTAWYNLGNAYSKSENFEKAIWAYDYCLLINEDFSPAYFNLGNAYLSEEKYLLSIQNFEKCIEFDGEDGLTLCYLGECYEQLGNLDEAKRFYYKSLELMPELSDAWLGLGIVKDLEGDVKGAIGFIEKAISYDAFNPGYIHVLAGALEKTDDLNLANETYLKALSMDTNNDEILTDYVNFLVKNDSYKQAVDFLEALDTVQEEIALVKDLHLFAILYVYFKQENILNRLIQAQVKDSVVTKEIISLYPTLINDPKIVNLLNN